MLCSDGSIHDLRVERWLADASHDECVLFGGIAGPVIDIGCGPGRHVAALASRGVPALGVDASRTAVVLATRRGAPVLHRSVFERLPGTGRWATALLLDGSVGIGGNPVRLMRRVRELLATKGVAIVELDGDGVGCTKTTARIQSGNEISAAFPWGRVGIDGIHEVATYSGFGIDELRMDAGRWFARLKVRSTF
jgi:SAM-dependent methyltransferase